MALELQTKQVIPNAVYFPMILLQTGIQDGELHTSAQIHFGAARVDENGKWESTGKSEMIHIGDISQLDDDLKELQEEMNNIGSRIIAIVGRINEIKKVL